MTSAMCKQHSAVVSGAELYGKTCVAHTLDTVFKHLGVFEWENVPSPLRLKTLEQFS